LALSEIKWEINTYGDTLPLSVGLQEVCEQQLFDMWWVFLYPKSSLYWAAMHIQRQAGTGVCGLNIPGGGAYGVGAYTLSQTNPYDTPSRVITVPFAHQLQPLGSDELRGSACIQGLLFNVNYWSCSAHATPYPSVNGILQHQQFQDYWNGILLTPQRVFWGGDLYVYVNSIPPNHAGWSFNSHREGDLCLAGTNGYRWTLSGGSPTSSADNTKVDYSFRSGLNSGSTCLTDMWVKPDLETQMWPTVKTNSDHRVIGGFQPW
jgi:hypothetical protein